MAQFDFDPVGAFQGARSNALTIQGQQQGIQREAAAAPVRNQLAQLELQKAQTGQRLSTEKEGREEALRKITIGGQLVQVLGGLDEGPDRNNAAAALTPFLKANGLPPLEPIDITDQGLIQMGQLSQGFLSDPGKLSAEDRRAIT
jgi:hypothetical protein